MSHSEILVDVTERLLIEKTVESEVIELVSTDADLVETTVSDLLVEQVVTPTTLHVPEVRQELLESARQGPPGPPGQAGVSYLSFKAAGSIGGHRYVVPLPDGACGYADNMNPAHANSVVGITMGAASDGEQVLVQTTGPMVENGWDWDLLKPVFLASNGLTSQEPPETGFSLVVGVPTAPNTLFVGIKLPFLLEQ